MKKQLIAAMTGLLLAAGATAAAAAPVATGRPLATHLEPGQEVAPFVGVPGASGHAALRLNPGQEQICVDMATDGVDLQLAHIHEGPAGENGPVVVDLTPLIDGDAALGCVEVDRATVRDIIRRPADYYVNVHEGFPPTDAFFRGIRGQLSR
jgi:hypothetical protein